MIKENILSIKEKIKKAAKKSGRDPSEIEIVCVTKYAQLPQIKEVIEQGLCNFGENKIQEALTKIEAFRDYPIKWHMVGHLQTNKIKKAVRAFEIIHSVDSLKLTLLINKEASKIGKVQKILIQINTQRRNGVFGLMEEEVSSLIQEIKGLSFLDVCGLMTIAPLCKDPEETRPFFKHLRDLKIKLERENEGVNLPILSMGMSQDFEVAVEEGATMLRIGRAIFEDK
jgi:hypothetical protein